MKIFVTVVLALAAAATGFGVAQWHRSAQTAGHDGAPEALADFALQDLQQNWHRPADYAGQVLLLNFWASWCTPCLKEMPLLNATYEAHKEAGFHVLGPAIDEQDAVVSMVNELKVTYPVSFGGEELFALMDALGDTLGALPFSVLVNRQGQIVERHWGEIDEQQIQYWLKQYL